VKTVPSFVEQCWKTSPHNLRSRIVSNQQEEYEHIEPWTKFAAALGSPKKILENYRGLDKTKRRHMQSIKV